MKLKDWSVELNETKIYFQVIYMPESIFIWSGLSVPILENLICCMKTPYDVIPNTSSLVGEYDEFSRRLALKLTQKYKKIVYISTNIPHETSYESLVEEHCLNCMKEYYTNTTIEEQLQQVKI